MLERHRLFIAAIGNQISHIEAALRESYDKEGKKPLRWVNLNEEECDDLATFLSGTCQVPRSAKTESSVCCSSANEEECDDLATFRRVDDGLCKMDRSTKARRASSPSAPDLQIVIVDENRERKQSITSLEVSRKGKSGSVFWKLGCQKFSQVSMAGNTNTIYFVRCNCALMRSERNVTVTDRFFYQFFGRVQQRQIYRPWHLQLACSVQFTLALMLTIFLIGEFLIFSRMCGVRVLEIYEILI